MPTHLTDEKITLIEDKKEKDSVVMDIKNISWDEFFKNIEDGNYPTSELDGSFVKFSPDSSGGAQLDPEQFVFLLRDTKNNFWRVVISSSDHIIPFYDNSAGFEIRTHTNTGRFIENGIIFTFRTKNQYGLKVWVPYNKTHKIYGYFISSNGDQIFNTNKIKYTDQIPKISYPKNKPSNLKKPLSESDKVRIANCSNKFKSLLSKWKTKEDVIEGIEEIEKSTIDPAYFNKILELNMNICFPPKE